MRCFIYTENYLFGGGVKYLIDYINALPDDIEVILASNAGAISQSEYGSITKSIDVITVDILSLNLLLEALILPFNFILKIIIKLRLRIITLILDKYSKRNKILFSEILISNRVNYVVVFNGGFPGGLTSFDLVDAAFDLKINSAMSIVSFPAPRGQFDIHYAKSMMRINYFIVNCNGIKNELIKSRLISQEKIYILPNKMDNINVKSIKRNKKFSPIRYGFIGRIHRDKGINDLIKSFNNPNIIDSGNTLTIFGHGKLLDRKCCEIVENSSHIKLEGPFDDVQSVLDRIDILILPSHAEGLPFVIIEALGSGIPVIATKVGCVNELVIDGYNGKLIDVSNEKQLIDAVLYFNQNVQKIYEMGVNSRLIFDKKFNPDTYKKNHDIIFSLFLNEN